MRGAVLRLRTIAFRLLPVLVVLWATVAVLGGAVYLAKHAGPPDAGGPAKAGLGLCAVSVALLAGRAARRVVIPSLASEVLPAFAARPPSRLVPGVLLLGPPATGPPIFVLLQVSRT
jgi:hypothetical protein